MILLPWWDKRFPMLITDNVIGCHSLLLCQQSISEPKIDLTFSIIESKTTHEFID
jgi:hypothetical protein